MSNNVDTVINYFKYCVDGKDVERVSEYFSEDLCIFRPDCAEPITTLEQFKSHCQPVWSTVMSLLKPPFRK